MVIKDFHSQNNRQWVYVLQSYKNIWTVVPLVCQIPHVDIKQKLLTKI